MYNLASTDYVGISFWLVSAAMLAATAFFFLERSSVNGKWKTSLTVAGLGNRYSILALFIYERNVDRDRNITNSI